ncbi:MAG: arginine--tRNA ligase [Gammaproteobacteria bacterium]
MKSLLRSLLSSAIDTLQRETLLPAMEVQIDIERARDQQHGDFASNVALGLSKAARRKPRELAELIASRLPASSQVDRVEIAGPGFINFFMAPTAFQAVVSEILDAAEGYGKSRLGKGAAVQVEFVSANPNGPLHVGHGRGAAIGSSIANLLDAVGFKAQREYYVNDAGRQMDILTVSVWLRYLELCGEQMPFPVNGYKGDYVRAIARQLQNDHGRAMCRAVREISAGLPADALPDGDGDKDVYIDALVARARELLGEGAYRSLFNVGLNTILADIRDDLEAFGVQYDNWFSERSLSDSDAADKAIARLKDSGDLYQNAGAWWFRSTAYGDEKDRVVVRENGQQTYFASDIAYHTEKLERGFTRIINVWGADHHGYVPRVKAALTALGEDAAKLDVVLVQFAILYRGAERAQMSTRSGEFVTLRELRAEVGNDAARFFYVMRKSDQHLDFDLELAKSRSNENPVFYVQYAHARICSVVRQGAERGYNWDAQRGRAHLGLLIEGHEQRLLMTLSRYPEIIEQAALAYEPHQLAYYLKELATDFHTYYNAHVFLVEDDNLRDARLSLLMATRQVLRNGLGLLGVSAPDTM